VQVGWGCVGWPAASGGWGGQGPPTWALDHGTTIICLSQFARLVKRSTTTPRPPPRPAPPSPPAVLSRWYRSSPLRPPTAHVRNHYREGVRPYRHRPPSGPPAQARRPSAVARVTRKYRHPLPPPDRRPPARSTAHRSVAHLPMPAWRWCGYNRSSIHQCPSVRPPHLVGGWGGRCTRVRVPEVAGWWVRGGGAVVVGVFCPATVPGVVVLVGRQVDPSGPATNCPSARPPARPPEGSPSAGIAACHRPNPPGW